MDDGAKTALDGNLADQAIFDPKDWRLTDFEADLCAETRRLAQSKFAARASIIDREARFPTENYADLRDAGLLGICIPAEHGGRGAVHLPFNDPHDAAGILGQDRWHGLERENAGEAAGD